MKDFNRKIRYTNIIKGFRPNTVEEYRKQFFEENVKTTLGKKKLSIFKRIIVKLLKGIVFIIWVGNKIIKLFKNK